MYWEALGLPGTAETPFVEELAKWVQWAQTGCMSGASENEEEINYNLDMFFETRYQGIQGNTDWNDEAELYGANTATELRQVAQLDTRAHGLRHALNSGLIYSRSPSYWEYWKSYMIASFTGTPTDVYRDITDETGAAEQAALDAADAARMAGQPGMESYFRRAAEQVKDTVADANRIWKAEGADIGIPGGINTLLIGAAALVAWIVIGKK